MSSYQQRGGERRRICLSCFETTPLGTSFLRQRPQQGTTTAKDQGRDGPRRIHSALNHSLYSLGKMDVVFSPSRKGAIYVSKKMLSKYNRSITYCQPMSYAQGLKHLLHYVFMFLSIYVYSIPSSCHCISCSDISSGIRLLPENFQYSEKYMT